MGIFDIYFLEAIINGLLLGGVLAGRVEFAVDVLGPGSQHAAHAARRLVRVEGHLISLAAVE